MVRSSFRDMLRLLRRANGWAQREVAERLHINRSTYAYYETGRTRPEYETLVNIAKLHGVSVDFLLGKDTPATSIEKAFFLRFLSLPEEEQARLLRHLEDLADSAEMT